MIESKRRIGLIPFQINPHYLDADANSTHMGETRARRIEEFLEEMVVECQSLFRSANQEQLIR